MSFLRLTYKDAKGNVSLREVGWPGTYNTTTFVSYCYLRKAPRTFLFTSVVEVIDLDTGEIMTGAGFLDACQLLRITCH